MKSMAGGIVFALTLFAVGAVTWSEARLVRRVADAHRRLATLHYDAEDDIDSAVSAWNRLPLLTLSSRDGVQRHRATVSYWLARYDSLTEMTNALAGQAPTDPALRFVAANASYRRSAPQAGDRKAAVDRLDGVMQAYAEVLRQDPSYSDAAFNYEFVSRVRDALAKAPPSKGPARDAKPVEKPALVSLDLPTGPTVHGRPGGPPDGTNMSDFKTVTPMRYDEREEQMDPGEGKKVRRKG